MEQLQLFRIKVHPTLGNLESSRGQLLLDRVSACPSSEMRTGYTWHIGNVERIDDRAVYFRFGRTTKTTNEEFHDGMFVDAPIETAPSTVVLLDHELELCAIASRSKLAPTIPGIAEKLRRLLQDGAPVPEFPLDFEVDDVKNPDSLLSILQQAYQIEKFWITVSRDNLFDVEKDFVAPVEKTVSRIKAEKMKAEFSGEDIDSEVTAELTRSAVASGDNAGATVRMTAGGPKTRPSTKESKVTLTANDLEDLENRAKTMNEMRRIYREIRGSE